jgi:hypothetical protein
MTEFQKGMQKSMTESNLIPHLYLEDEFNITALVMANLFENPIKKDALRDSLKK